MKKGLILTVLSMLAVVASAKTYIDKTNLDQLSFRVLDSGQVAWNEEDGSAVIYMGSPTEVKNIRVTDPTALRGYRMKTITDELTLAASANMNAVVGGFRWVANSSADAAIYQYEYVDLAKTGHDRKYDAAKGTAGEPSHWESGLYIKNNDGTYTATTVADGTIVGGSNSVQNIQYAYRHKYLMLQVDVISKDSSIEELDFLFSQSAGGGLGDMDPIGTSRRISYDGRRATVTVKVNYVSGNGKFVELTGFTAKCLGIGDVVQANDLLVNKIFFYDKLTDENGRSTGHKIRIKGVEDDEDEEDPTAGAFDLYNLRYWAKHLYDGNRGQDWANYAATNHINMKTKSIYWGASHNSEGDYIYNAMMGVSGNSFFFNVGNDQWLVYTPAGASDIPVQYQGIEIAITAIHQDTSSEANPGCWTIDVDINVPSGKTAPGLDQLEVLYSAGMERPCLWYPIVCTWESTGANSYHVVIPIAYAEPSKGFWKVRFNHSPTSSKLKIKAGLQVIGTDGRMYDLAWPEGGGAVTATLAE